MSFQSKGKSFVQEESPLIDTPSMATKCQVPTRYGFVSPVSFLAQS